MSALDVESDRNRQARIAVHAALRMVSSLAPHLAGLAALASVEIDARIATAAVFRSGRIAVNPGWFLALNPREAAFVAAHELMHLALRSHDRMAGSAPRLFNIAHDYVINHALTREFDMSPPAGGLQWPLSSEPPAAEKIVDWLRRNPDSQPRGSYSPVSATALGSALARSGLVKPLDGAPAEDWDVLSDERERQLYPHTTRAEQHHRQTVVVEQAARAASLERVAQSIAGSADSSPAAEELVRALRTAYRPPWEFALQRWLEAVAPGPRTWQRASRRDAGASGAVLPGRRREGWALHIILDTSGSMSEILPGVLGVIAAYCDQANVAAVHLLQCDTQVTVDEWIAPSQLDRYRISGYGGSALSPAFHRLAQDPEVEAAIAITDGYIDYPELPPPYAVLWTIAANPTFTAPYGHVLHLDD